MEALDKLKELLDDNPEILAALGKVLEPVAKAISDAQKGEQSTDPSPMARVRSGTKKLAESQEAGEKALEWTLRTSEGLCNLLKQITEGASLFGMDL